MDEVETVERMPLVLDAAEHMRAANPACMALDRRRRIDHMELVTVLQTVTFSRGTTATTEKVAPSGFQHFVQPQAWLWATSPLMPTLTGLSSHWQTRVPPMKLPVPWFTPLSSDGWI